MYKFTNQENELPLRYVRKLMQCKHLAKAFFIAILMLMTILSFAQSVTFHSKSATLKQVFKEIKKQTGYNVVWTSDQLNAAKPIVADFNATPLDQVLAKVFAGQGLTYTIEKKTIVVKSATNPAANKTTDVQPTIDVKGKVLDENGNALAGATIKQKDGLRIAVTNAAGEFALNKIDANATLLFSFVGDEMREIQASPNMGSIKMIASNGNLDDAKVTVSNGYQRIPKERSAGSFSTITKETLDKRSNYDLTDYLTGQVSGLLNQTGQILIRGQSTFTSNTQPLIVVDGFVVNYGLSAINPNDVESITVLKDASAASIWGVRAANGVIVVQTKRGTSVKKPLEVSFSSSISVAQKLDLGKLPFANATSFLEYEKIKAGLKSVYAGVAPNRRAISQGLDAYINHPLTADSIVSGLKGNNLYNEFSDLFMQPAIRQQYYLSLASKGQRGYSRASFNFDGVQTSMKNTGNQRFVADLFQHSNITSKLSLELGLNYMQISYQANGMTLFDLNSTAPYQKILDKNGKYISQPMGIYQADKDALVAKGFPYNWDYNMMQEYQNKDNSGSNKVISASVNINYIIAKGLSFNSGYKLESNISDYASNSNDQTYLTRNTINSATSPALVLGIPKGSIITQQNAKGQMQIFRNQLRYDGKIINQHHQLTAIGGMEIQQVNSEGTSSTQYGFDPQTLVFSTVKYNTPYIGYTGSSTTLPSSYQVSSVMNRYVSYYANAGYTYLGKYSINGSARQDRTNLFGAGDDFKNVWLYSYGAAWQAHKESFLRNSPFSSMIFRASYGVNGNVDRTTSPFLIANIAPTDRSTGQPYAYVVNPENPALRWEKTKVTNVGVDFTTLRGRLSGTVEYYNKLSSDLLGNSTVNGTYGFNSAYINYASMTNKGIDVHLFAQVIKGKFYVNVTANYSYNKQNVTEVQFPQSTAGSFIAGAPQKDLPLYYLYAYKWAGLSATGGSQVFDAKGNKVNYTAEMTDPTALSYLGSMIPPHYGGFYTEVGYKSLSLTAGLVYKAGNKFRVPVIQYGQIFGSTTTGNLSSDWDKRWKKAGDENTTNTPAMPTSAVGLTNYDYYTTYADINVQNASTIRFQELLLNYRLPVGLLSKIGSPTINIGFQVRNLAVYTFNKNKLDPEYLTQNSYPALTPPPEYTLMIKANF